MALYRCIETRLLEAVWTETKNCFAQSSLGLASTYASRIYARPFSPSETLSPFTIYINPVAPKWEPGVGGVGDNFYIVEVMFIFPFDLLNIVAGQNTFLDHVHALRQWLTAGGSWTNKTMAIQDPDNLGHEVAHLTAITQESPGPAPNNAGVSVPVLLEYETREDRGGVVK